MLDWISQLLLPNENPTAIQSLIVMILTIGLGVFLGNLKIKNTSLGVSAVMFAGLFLGHYGYRMDASISNFIRDLGLIFFVYAIGLQLGPSFFSAFKAQGLKYSEWYSSQHFIGFHHISKYRFRNRKHCGDFIWFGYQHACPRSCEEYD